MVVNPDATLNKVKEQARRSSERLKSHLQQPSKGGCCADAEPKVEAV